MPDIRCEKCGEALKADALNCWACGTLTPAGLRARQGTADDDEWRKSVEAARQRQAQPPPVDPDEALKRVLADTGDELPTGKKRPEPVLDVRRDSQLVTAAQTLGSLGALLAFLTSLGGLIGAVAGILSGNHVGLLAGIAAFVAVGGLALFVYFHCKFLAEMGQALADALQQVRRLQGALEDHERSHRASSEERP
jgi:hypothetical protein